MSVRLTLSSEIPNIFRREDVSPEVVSAWEQSPPNVSFERIRCRAESNG